MKYHYTEHSAELVRYIMKELEIHSVIIPILPTGKRITLLAVDEIKYDFVSTGKRRGYFIHCTQDGCEELSKEFMY